MTGQGGLGEAPHATRVFDSLEDLADFAAEGHFVSDSGDAWAGGGLRECIRRTRQGDLTLVAQSDALLRKFEALTFQTPRREWRGDVSGYVANVPAYIAGHPASMRRRERRGSPVAPVMVVVDVFASAAFAHSDILARGAAVLALTRVLAAVRPLTLYVACATTARTGRSGCVAVRIDTTPLDLAHAAWALCGIGFLRRVMTSALEGTLVSAPFPPLRVPLREIASAAGLGRGGEHVITIDGIVSNVTRDPGAWIEARIREAAPEVLGAGQCASETAKYERIKP